MGYRAYPEYRESRIEWLGKCPAHWDVIAIKQLTPVRRGASPRPIQDPKYFDDEGEYSWVRIADVTANNHYLEETTQRLSALGKSLSVPLEPGSLFLSIAGSVGKPMIANIKCCIHDGFVYFPYYQHDTEFLYYIFECGQAFLGLGKLGTQLNLNTDTVGSIKIGLPPIEEQQKIASFLACKTAQIDHLIEKKQELIEKLQEQRSSIITTAVTRGVNAQVLTGPCAQDWLGGAPEHWEKNYKLNFLSTDDRNSFVNGPFGSDLLTSELVNHGVPVIYSGDIKETGFQRKSDKYVTEEKAKQLDFCRVDGGNILLAKVGDPPGDACVYPMDQPSGIVTQDVVRIKVDKGTVDAEYLCLLLNSKYGRHLVKRVSVEATRGRFSLADLKSIRHILPPLEEQQEIVLYIQQQMKRCNRLSDLATREIEALQEYRSALITAAVTGQIDVRDWQAPEVPEQSAQDKEVI